MLRGLRVEHSLVSVEGVSGGNLRPPGVDERALMGQEIPDLSLDGEMQESVFFYWLLHASDRPGF